MGTFHDDTHELHGITVLVETRDGGLIVGRFHEPVQAGVLLLDADIFDAAKPGKTREEWLDFARRFGVWPKHKQLVVEQDRIARLSRLGA
jgi:hypothetical protein